MQPFLIIITCYGVSPIFLTGHLTRSYKGLFYHSKGKRTGRLSNFLETLKYLKPGFHMLRKSQTVGDFAVSRPSKILPICRGNRRSSQKSGTHRENRNAPDFPKFVPDHPK